MKSPQKTGKPSPHATWMLRGALLTPLPIALLLRWWAAGHPAWTERLFTSGLYARMTAPISRIAGVFPLPLIEIFVVLFLGYMVYWVLKRRFFKALAACGLILALFFGGFALGYCRLPLPATLGLTVGDVSPEALYALCQDLIKDANDRYTKAPDNPLQGVREAMNLAADKWPIPKGQYGPPKKALLSPLFSRLLIAGITSPFTFEPLINGDMPEADFPFVALHEMAHVRGFAREEDANLIAYLACEASDDPFIRYSGAVNALSYALHALKGADYASYMALVDTLSPDVKATFAASDAFWEPYRHTRAAETGTAINDAYLSHVGAGDQSGLSYGRVVDLLLALYQQENGQAPAT